MTIHQLSADCVKVQVTAEEYTLYRNTQQGMLSLLARMLSEAERISRIPFSQLPVTAELLAMPDGGISAYFSAESKRKPRTQWLAARFPAMENAAECCRQLVPHRGGILHSMLYRERSGYVLLVKVPRGESGAVRHILMEYGRIFRLTQIARARLNEYGRLLHGAEAVEELGNT